MNRLGRNWITKIGTAFMFAYTIMLSYILIGSWWNGVMFGNYGMTIFTNIYGEAWLEAWVITPIVLIFSILTHIEGRKL